MISYSVPLITKTLTDEICPVCKTTGNIKITLYMRYMRSWIPVFGMGERTIAHCGTCNHTLKIVNHSIFTTKETLTNLDIEINNLQKNHKRTLWQLIYPWSFSIIVLAVALLSYFRTNIQKDTASDLVDLHNNPKVNDLYLAQWKNTPIEIEKSVILKLVRINGDTLIVVPSNESMTRVDKKSWEDLEDKATFGTTEYKLSKSHFIKNSDFFEYPNAANNNQLTQKGSLLGKGYGNFSFDIIIRK